MEEESSGMDKLLENRDQLMRLTGSLLSSILSETSAMPKGNSRFHCKDVPAISIPDFLRRISKYSHCSNSVYILSLIYIDRIQQQVEGFVINYHCIHRLLITAVMVAAKFLDDFYYKNQYYAKIGGISKSEINLLEYDFVTNIDFNLNVSQLQFRVYLEKMIGYKDLNPL